MPRGVYTRTLTPLRDRFNAKWEPEPNTGCWLWTGSEDGHGYGQLRHQQKVLGAHRISYELHVGPITKGLLVLHTCDTPACVNPEHLFLGTQEDNMRDMQRKGRRRSDDCLPRGMGHWKWRGAA